MPANRYRGPPMTLANMCFAGGPQSALGSDGAPGGGLELTTNEHRLLELLAGNTKGATEALLLAHGFTLKAIVNLVGAKLATLTTERMLADGGDIKVTRVQITDAGRRVLA
jgi:hypothetical protein